MNKLKSSEVGPIELSSKFSPDSSGGQLVSYDDAATKSGVVTVSRINGVKKGSQPENQVLSVQNIQRKSVVSSEQHKPALTK